MLSMFKVFIKMYVLEEAIGQNFCDSKEMLILSSRDST
jgi:hypothetical protein